MQIVAAADANAGEGEGEADADKTVEADTVAGGGKGEADAVGSAPYRIPKRKNEGENISRETRSKKANPDGK